MKQPDFDRQVFCVIYNKDVKVQKRRIKNVANIVLLQELGNNSTEEIGITEKDTKSVDPVNPLEPSQDHDFGEEEHEYGID